MSLATVQIIPAQPRTYKIYETPNAEKLLTFDPVIAWRISSDEDSKVIVTPIDSSGQEGNHVGIQHTNGHVEVYGEAYNTLTEATTHLYPAEEYELFG